MADNQDSLMKQLLGPVKEVDNNATYSDLIEKSNDILAEIKKIVGDHKDQFKDASKRDERFLASIFDAIKQQNEETNKQKSNEKKTQAKSLNSQLLNLFKKRDKNSGVLNDKLSIAIANLEKTTAQATKSAHSIGGGGGGGGKPPKGPSGASAAAEYGDNFAYNFGQAMRSTLESVMGGLLGGASAFQIITNGMLVQEYEYAQGMNMILYQTQAVTEEAFNLQQAFRQTKDVVRSTGFDLTTFQNQLLKTTKRGIKSAQVITKTGLNLGKVIGLNEQEASQVADTLVDWNLHLGLSNNNIADVSRGIKEVSRVTGVTGENLAEVVKSSDRFLDRMRSAGTLTANAAKNVLMMQAEAKKLGVDDSFGGLMTAMGNSSELLFKSSKETQALLFNAGASVNRIQDLMNGTILQTKSGLKDMSAGLENVFQRVSGGLSIDEIENLNPQRKAQLNLILESAFGVGLDDFKRIVDVTKKGGQTFADTMSGIDKELGKHATAEEKLVVARKKQELLLNKAFDFSTQLSETVNVTGDMESAIKRIQQQLGPEGFKEMQMDLATVAGTFSKELQDKVLKGDTKSIAQAMAVSAADALKKAGGKDFTAQITKAIFNKDFASMRKIQEEMNSEQQKLGVETITKLDPIEQAAMQLKLMNETLRGYTSPTIMYLASIAGSTAFMAAYMGGLALQTFKGAEAAAYWGQALNLGGGAARTVGTGAAKAAPAAGALLPTALNLAPAGTTIGASGLTAAAGGTGAGTTAAAASAGTPIGWIIAGALEAVLAVTGGVLGNLWAGAEAANYFNTTMEDLTMGQYYAAKGAGTLTGALNFMTFGVFDKWLGTTGAVTKALAQFNEKVPILSLIAGLLDIIVGAVWGVVKLISNVLIGAFEMLYLALEPVGELFMALVDVVAAVLSPLAGFNTKLNDTGSLFQLTADLIGNIGMVIRNVLRAVGYVVGTIIQVVVTPIAALLKAIANSIETLLSPVKNVLSGLAGFVLHVVKAVSSLVALDIGAFIKNLGLALQSAVKAVFSATVGLILAIPQTIFSLIKNVFSIIGSLFDNVEGSLGDVLQLIVYPFKIISKLAGAIANTFGGLSDVIIGLVSFDGEQIKRGFYNLFNSIPIMLHDVIGGGLTLLHDVFVTGLKYIFVDLPQMLWSGMMDGLKSLATNDWIGPIFEPFLEILTPLHDAMKELWGALSEVFDAVSTLFEPLKELGLFSGEAFDMMSILKSVIQVTAIVLGKFIRVSLIPLKLVITALVPVITTLAKMFKIIANNIQGFGTLMANFVNAFLSPFKTIYNVIVAPISSAMSYVGSFFDFILQKAKQIFDFANNALKVGQNGADAGAGAVKFAINPTGSVINWLIKKVTGFADGTTQIEKEGIAMLHKGEAIIPAQSVQKMSAQGNGPWPLSLPLMLRDIIGDVTQNPMKHSPFGAMSSLAQMPFSSGLLQSLGLADEDNSSMSIDPAVKPKSLTDVHQKIQQDYSTRNEGKRNGTAELTEMVDINQDQLGVLIGLREDISKLINLFTPKDNISGLTGGGERQSTRSNIKPINSPTFNTWQFGKYQQNASKQVITDGR